MLNLFGSVFVTTGLLFEKYPVGVALGTLESVGVVEGVSVLTPTGITPPLIFASKAPTRRASDLFEDIIKMRKTTRPIRINGEPNK